MRLSRLMAAAALVLSGCANDNSPFVIIGFYPLAVTAGSCGVATSDQQVAEGLLDSSKGGGYIVGLQVESQLASNSGAEGRTNTNNAYVDSVSTTFQSDGSVAPPQPTTMKITSIITPGGQVFFPATLLTAENGQSLEGQTGGLVAHITVHGHLEDGSLWSTATESFPIAVGSGYTKICPDGNGNLVDGTPSPICPDAGFQPDGVICKGASGG